MTIINNTVADDIINDLLTEVGEWVRQREEMILEIEALEIGKKRYMDQLDWIKVSSYNKAIENLQRRVRDLDDLIEPRRDEIRRAREQNVI